MIDPSSVQPSHPETFASLMLPHLPIRSELALLQAITLAISQASDVRAALQQVLVHVCQETCWVYGEVWLPTEAGDRLQHSQLWFTANPNFAPFGEESVAYEFLPDEGLPGRVWGQRQPEWVEDVSQEPESRFPRLWAAIRYGLRAAIGIPIESEKQVVAVLVFLMPTAAPENLREMQLIQAIASQLGIFLSLKQTESALKRHEAWLHRLINAMPGIVFTSQGASDWRMRYLSEGCQQLTGYSPADFTEGALRYNDIIHPDDLPHVIKTIHTAMAAGHAYMVEYRLITRSGEEKWVWEKGQGIYNDAGTPQGLEGFVTDISVLKQTETALRESEARYRLLAERSHDLISQHTLKGLCRYASPASFALLGYHPEELLGRSIHELVHPEDWNRVRRAYCHFLRHQTSQTLQFRLRHRKGHYRWFEAVSGLIERSAETGERQILTVSRDITDRVEAEHALLNRERLLKLILDNIPQHLFWKDRNGVYLGSNRVFAQSLGFQDPQQIVGKTDFDLGVYPQEDAEYFRQRDALVMQYQQADVHQTELQPYADGSHRWVICSRHPIFDASGAVIGLLGTFEDISDRLATQKALARRDQYLSALVEVQRELLTLDATWDRDRYTEVLAHLGKAASASRAYLYEVVPDRDMALQRAEWSAQGIPSTVGIDAFATLPTDGPFADWVAILRGGGVINQTVEQFSPTLQTILGSPPSSIKSVLLLPLLIKGNLYGLIGFSNCTEPRSWTRSEVALLQAAASAFALAIERYETEVSLREAETKYRSIFENAVEGIFQSTLDGHYLTVNPMLARIYGYDSPEHLITSLTDIQHQLYVDPLRRETFVRRMLKQGSVFGFESQVYRKDGSIIWISESARTLYDEAGEPIGFEGTVEDISARKESESELHRRDRLLQGVAQASQYLLTANDLHAALPQVLSILGAAADADRVYIYENHPHPTTGQAAMSMRYEWTQSGISPSIQQPHWQNQVYSAHGLERWYRAFLTGEAIRGVASSFPIAEYDLLQRDGIQAILMVPIFIDQELWGYIGIDSCREARQWSRSEESILVAIAASIGGALKRQRTEDQMRHQAFHDSLTGLPNRTLFNQHLPLAIAHAQRSGEILGVLFLDLDRFKTINDTLGHAVGDQLLVQATQRIKAALREQDVVARWGGDEFTLILPGLQAPEDAAKVAQRLSELLRPPFAIEHQELFITSSVGIALYPQDGHDMTTLLQHADAAMYRAKAEGRNTYRFHTTTIHSSASQLLTLEKYLHHALEKDELRLFFQPQVNLKTRQICQVEALLRWQNAALGWVMPNEFIPIAEEIGLIVEFGDWVMHQACQQLQQWHAAGFSDLHIAVNLSARQLQCRDLVTRIRTALCQAQLSAHYLELEVTETAALLDIDASIATLNELQHLGTRVVMDDFGTGYSSLSYLKRLPLQGLKIDRTFVADIPQDAQGVAMLRAITALGHELQLGVVAEGVETPEQMQCLLDLGCTDMQGFWFSPPLDATAMTTFLHQHWPRYNVEPTDPVL